MLILSQILYSDIKRWKLILKELCMEENLPIYIVGHFEMQALDSEKILSISILNQILMKWDSRLLIHKIELELLQPWLKYLKKIFVYKTVMEMEEMIVKIIVLLFRESLKTFGVQYMKSHVPQIEPVHNDIVVVPVIHLQVDKGYVFQLLIQNQAVSIILM